MKYLFLAYQDEDQWAKVSDRERELIGVACKAHELELRQNGYLLALEYLQSNQTAVTVQIVNGRVSLTDTTMAETKRRLLQLFLINARDLNEVIQIISKMPHSRLGPFEVYPLLGSVWQQFSI